MSESILGLNKGMINYKVDRKMLKYNKKHNHFTNSPNGLVVPASRRSTGADRGGEKSRRLSAAPNFQRLTLRKC